MTAGGEQFLAAHQLRVVQTLLWEAVSERLPPAERDEVRKVIGGTFIQANEDIFNEATTLAQILGDVQLATGDLLQRQELISSGHRTMVEDHIRLLMTKLRCDAASSPFRSSSILERDPDSVLPRSSAKDKAVYEYVTTVQGADGRPLTASSLPRPGTATSSRPDTGASSVGGGRGPLSRPSTASSEGGRSAGSAASSPLEVIAELQDRLNVYDIDAVRDHIRSALQDERAALLEDVDYLTTLLLEASDDQKQASVPPPSMTELRDYSTKLQEAVVREEQRVEHERRVTSMFDAAKEQTGKSGRLRGMVGASRQTVPVLRNGAGGSVAQTFSLEEGPISPRALLTSPRGARHTPLPSTSGGGRGSEDASSTSPTSSSSLLRPAGSFSRPPLAPFTEWTGSPPSAAAAAPAAAPRSSSRTRGDGHHPTPSAPSSSGGAPPPAAAAAAGPHGLPPQHNSPAAASSNGRSGMSSPLQPGSRSSSRGRAPGHHPPDHGAAPGSGHSKHSEPLPGGPAPLLAGAAGSNAARPAVPLLSRKTSNGADLSGSARSPRLGDGHLSTGPSHLSHLDPVAVAKLSPAQLLHPLLRPAFSGDVQAAPGGNHSLLNGMRSSSLGGGADGLMHPGSPHAAAPSPGGGGPAGPSPTADRRRVRSVTQHLEAEMDAVQGGVSAILAKHGYKPGVGARPGTAGSGTSGTSGTGADGQ